MRCSVAAIAIAVVDNKPCSMHVLPAPSRLLLPFLWCRTFRLHVISKFLIRMAVECMNNPYHTTPHTPNVFVLFTWTHMSNKTNGKKSSRCTHTFSLGPFIFIRRIHAHTMSGVGCVSFAFETDENVALTPSFSAMGLFSNSFYQPSRISLGRASFSGCRDLPVGPRAKPRNNGSCIGTLYSIRKPSKVNSNCNFVGVQVKNQFDESFFVYSEIVDSGTCCDRAPAKNIFDIHGIWTNRMFKLKWKIVGG